MDNKNVKRKIPVLLLSYTYFLNQVGNAYVSVGFDSVNFQSKIVLHVNKKHFSFQWNDWCHLMRNLRSIDTHFHSQSEVSIENQYGVVEIKLSNKTRGKAVSFGLSRVTLKQDDWKVLSLLTIYLNSIMKWNQTCETSVASYYFLYLKQCVKCNSIEISPHHILSKEVAQYNITRLHIEIPILMKQKLQQDYVHYSIFGFVE